MRIEASVTSLSWIPSEAVTGVNKAIFGTGFTHYDDPPPDRIDDLDVLQNADRFRFANRLGAWVEVDGGAIVDAGYTGGCSMGSTTIAVGSKQATFAAVAFPDICRPVEIDGDSARFVQTVGGRTALPRAASGQPSTVRRVPGPVGLDHPRAHDPGRRHHRTRARRSQPVPAALGLRRRRSARRQSGSRGLQGLVPHCLREAHAVGRRGLAGDGDRSRDGTGTTRRRTDHARRGEAVVPQAGERNLLTEQGAAGDEIFLLLNGVLSVEVDGPPLAEVGPGAILGERALLESQPGPRRSGH